MAGCLGIGWSSPSRGEEAYDPFEGVETFTVMQERSTALLQSIPSAVTAFSGDELEVKGITQLQDFQTLVPNLHYGQERGEAKITIRGVSNAQGTDQSTAVHLDGVYQDRARALTSLSFFDVQSVIVHRGPQGTLFGRNATAGTMNIVSNPPTQQLEVSGDVQIGTYDQRLVRGVLNVPLVDDLAALRVSGFWETRDGYQKNYAYQGQEGVDADDADDLALRGQLLLTPGDAVDVTLRVNHARKRGVGYALKREGPLPEFLEFPLIGPQPIYAGSSPNPEDERKVFLDERGSIRNDMWNGNAEIRWDVPRLPLFGDTSLRVLGSFTDFDDQSVTDQDYADVPLAVAYQQWQGHEWVAELHWGSDERAERGWSIGLFHFGTTNEHVIDAPATLPIVPPQPPPIEIPVPFYQDFDRSTYSAAAFGNGWIQLTDRLRLEAGVRYTRDWKRSKLESPSIFLLGSRFVLFQEVDDSRDDSWGWPTGNVSLDYEFGPTTLGYVRVATGYKSGTLNNDIPPLGGEFADPDCDPDDTVPACDGLFSPEIADPEKLYAIEAGLKNDLFDDRLMLNATGFFYWYDDLQVSQIFETQTFVENAATARIWGVEIESRWNPFGGLTIETQLSFLDTEYTDYEDCRDAKDLSVQDCTGNELSRSPRFTGNVITSYAIDLDRLGTLTPQVQVFASDDVYFRPTNEAADKQDAYWLLDLRLGWRSEDQRFGLDLFVDNVLDKDIATTKIVGSSLLGSPLLDAYDRPRTAGARVSFGW